MFEDALDSGGSTQSSMFPFLSVLFCMIGALVVIMVMGSMRTTLKNTNVLAKIDAAEQEQIDLAAILKQAGEAAKDLARVSTARDTISSAEKQTARGNFEVKKVSARLSGLRKKGREARSRSDKVVLVKARHKAQLARSDLSGSNAAIAKQITEVKKKVEELNATSADLTAQRDDLKLKAESPEVRFRLVEKDSGRTPVYLELVGDSLVVRSEGTPKEPGAKIPVAEAVAAGGYLEKLAAKFARPGASRYAMLLVRPGTADSFHATTVRLRTLRVPFAYEPVEKGWDLKFE